MSRSQKYRSDDMGTGSENVYRLKPLHYMHILDNNNNVTRVLTGPLTYTKFDHETVIVQPTPCIQIPPRCYCTILNPVVRDENANPVKDPNTGATKVRLGDQEVRFEQPPFPLYPEETITVAITPLTVLPQYEGLKLRATRDFEDRVAGELWMFVGPGTYIPRIEVQVVEKVKATVIKDGCAIKLKAACDTTDGNGVKRLAGEEWLFTTAGTYMPSVDEEIVAAVTPEVLTYSNALQLEALKSFTDVLGKKRSAGEKWLVTSEQTEAYLVTPNERKLATVEITVVPESSYCVINNAFMNGKSVLGRQEIRQGPCSFFLNPGEYISGGIQDMYVLTEEESLLLQANVATEAENKEGKVVKRNPGDKWMIYGPRTYCPTLDISVLEERSSIPLAENEGIYVRDQLTGQVRMEIGSTYMLQANEELWEKSLPEIVEKQLLRQGAAHNEYIEGGKGARRASRTKWKVVSYQLPHNAVCQVYDFKSRSQRIVFGPDMVMLGPDEEFTVLSLSGSEWIPGEANVVRPKVPDMIKAVFLFLGPDNMSDIITVETADHARLSLQLSYNWYFDVQKGNEAQAKKAFNVPDFVGDTCKAVASRIRGAVAAVSFDEFHKNSATLVRCAVFGMEEDGKATKNKLVFDSNGLVIYGVDIQVAECIDQRTRDSLQKSVKLAIEIATASSEAAARHAAEQREQQAKGELERQIISDKSACEQERKALLALQAESSAVEATGGAKAEAKAEAAAAIINGEAEVSQAKLRAEAETLLASADLTNLDATRTANVAHQKELNTLAVARERQMAEIEVSKFQKAVTSIGRDTIASMARAGPEMQARMLKGLGLQGYMLTDGSSPINLMNTAQQMVGNVQ